MIKQTKKSIPVQRGENESYKFYLLSCVSPRHQIEEKEIGKTMHLHEGRTTTHIIISPLYVIVIRPYSKNGHNIKNGNFTKMRKTRKCTKVKIHKTIKC